MRSERRRRRFSRDRLEVLPEDWSTIPAEKWALWSCPELWSLGYATLWACGAWSASSLGVKLPSAVSRPKAPLYKDPPIALTIQPSARLIFPLSTSRSWKRLHLRLLSPKSRRGVVAGFMLDKNRHRSGVEGATNRTDARRAGGQHPSRVNQRKFEPADGPEPMGIEKTARRIVALFNPSGGRRHNERAVILQLGSRAGGATLAACEVR